MGIELGTIDSASRPATLRVANAPCSWGVIEGVEGDRDQYRRVLDEMRESGFDGTELGDWGFMPTDPHVLREELSSRSLSLVGSWVSVYLHDEARRAQDVTDALRTARQLAAVGGPDCVVVLGNDPYGDPMRTLHAGRITPEMSMDDRTWAAFARGANEIARTVRDHTGLRTVFHHHIGTWVETPDETRRLMEMTDPALLGLCFDTGHWLFGGGEVAGAVKEFSSRIGHVHFKDCSSSVADRARREGLDAIKSVGNGVFCELGTGAVPFAAVRDALSGIGYGGWIVVEQDILPGMGTPKQSARRNRAFLHSIGL